MHFSGEEKRVEGGGVEWSGGEWVRVSAGLDWGSFRGKGGVVRRGVVGKRASGPLYRVAAAEVPMHIPPPPPARPRVPHGPRRGSGYYVRCH
jgi:hypothetical protein